MPSRRATLLTAMAALALPRIAAADAEHPEHVPASQAGEDLQEYVEGASRLEGRIIAPCCWNQTIDIHGSEPSYQLRREIRRRLKAGESPEAIEASFVKRYGAKILAVPDTSPLGSLATVLAIGFGAAGVGAYFMLRRWSRVGKPLGGTPSERAAELETRAPQRDALDERLDRELSQIGDQA